MNMKSCPTCGTDPNQKELDELYAINPDGDRFIVGCFKCKNYTFGTSKEIAIERWNRQAWEVVDFRKGMKNAIAFFCGVLAIIGTYMWYTGV